MIWKGTPWVLLGFPAAEFHYASSYPTTLTPSCNDSSSQDEEEKQRDMMAFDLVSDFGLAGLEVLLTTTADCLPASFIKRDKEIDKILDTICGL